MLEGISWQHEILLIVFVVLFFNFFAQWALQRLHKHFERQNKVWQDSFVQALRAPLSLYIWIFAGLHVLHLILPRISSFDYSHNLQMMLSVAGVLCVAWFAFRWKNTLIRLLSAKIRKKEMVLEQEKLDVLDKLFTVIIAFITVLMLLEVTNRQMSTLIAFGGIGGLALAFASQEVFSNYFSGIMIYMTRPFSVGDWIQLPDKDLEGYVEEIGWYMTQIRTFEKRPIFVPNSIFSKMVLVTPSRMSHRRFDETLHLRYSDFPAVPAIISSLNEAFTNHPDVDTSQKIEIYLEALGKYALEISVSAYSTKTEGIEFYAFKQEMLLTILEVLKKHNAEIAYPVTSIQIPDGINLK